VQTKIVIGEGIHTGKEAVKLHQNLQIDVVALGSLAVATPHMVAVQVDTCDLNMVSVIAQGASKKEFELDDDCSRQ
jgi:phosphoribosylformimino-5-aminoimidazole carboxamide ribonucleotide (ProFAR) isomerase